MIGKGSKIWHFCHMMNGAKIGERCVFGQNVNVDGGVIIGNNVKSKTTSRSTRGWRSRTTFSGPLLRSDQCHQSTRAGESTQPVRKNAYPARRDDRRQRHHRVRRHHRPVRVRGGRGRRDEGRAGLRAGDGQSGAKDGLDEPAWARARTRKRWRLRRAPSRLSATRRSTAKAALHGSRRRSSHCRPSWAWASSVTTTLSERLGGGGSTIRARGRMHLGRDSKSTDKVASWVEAHDYKGYDPGDGLNSFLRPLALGTVWPSACCCN